MVGRGMIQLGSQSQRRPHLRLRHPMMVKALIGMTQKGTEKMMMTMTIHVKGVLVGSQPPESPGSLRCTSGTVQLVLRHGTGVRQKESANPSNARVVLILGGDTNAPTQ